MQSLIRRAWSHDQTDKKPEKVLLPKPKMRPSSIVEMSPLFRIKRKRSDSPESVLLPGQDTTKRQKTFQPEQFVHLLPDGEQPNERSKDGCLVKEQSDRQNCFATPSADAESSETKASSHCLQDAGTHSGLARPDAKVSSAPQSDEPTIPDTNGTANDARHAELQQIVEHQVNLEILLKHRELRLIEQELAKCQTALEQLRRCELVPYPGTTGLIEAISTGTGPSLKAEPGFTQPQAPAPWGVTDGPYTRHYSRWLLNDPKFDALPAQQVQVPADYFSSSYEGRSTRNSGAGLGRSGKSRVSRDSVGNFGHALPNYPVNSRGKGGPLVIKRMADNQFVKLICNNCQRGDFSSVQGFLNHCRIAHKVDYKSHEAAATDCGRPLEDDETHLAPATTPAAATTTTTTTTTAAAVAAPATRAPGPRAPASVPPPPSAGSVHPLNAPVMPRYTWKVQAAAARAANAAISTTQSHSSGQNVPTVANTPLPVHPFHSAPLVASSTMPHLSNLFAKRGFGGDLPQATARAREEIDLGLDTADEDESSTASSRKPSISKKAAETTELRFAGSATNALLGRPQSRKGQQTPMARPRPAPLSHHQTNARGSEIKVSGLPQDASLSPHTADSNPGLVSDHEDDDAVSELDEARSERHVSPHVPMAQLGGMRRGLGGCGAEAIDVDIEADEDVDGHHGLLIRPRGLAFQEFAQRPASGSNQRPVNRFGGAAK